jgi:hypothetical protein
MHTNYNVETTCPCCSKPVTLDYVIDDGISMPLSSLVVSRGLCCYRADYGSIAMWLNSEMTFLQLTAEEFVDYLARSKRVKLGTMPCSFDIITRCGEHVHCYVEQTGKWYACAA